MGKTRTSFQKGQSGNPGGRPKSDPSAMEWLKQHSKGGRRYYELLDQIAEGELKVKRTIVNNTGEFVESEDPPTVKDRIAALTLLTNRIDGTPKASTEISSPDGTGLVIRVVSYASEDANNAERESEATQPDGNGGARRQADEDEGAA